MFDLCVSDENELRNRERLDVKYCLTLHCFKCSSTLSTPFVVVLEILILVELSSKVLCFLLCAYNEWERRALSSPRILRSALGHLRVLAPSLLDSESYDCMCWVFGQCLLCINHREHI